MPIQPYPHTCSHCDFIQVTIPSHAEYLKARSRATTQHPQFFDFVSIEGPKVLAGSSVCAFYAWAIAAFRKEYRDRDLNNSWSFIGSIASGHFDPYPNFSFIWFAWRSYAGGVMRDVSLDWLVVLAEASMSCLSSVLDLHTFSRKSLR